MSLKALVVLLSLGSSLCSETKEKLVGHVQGDIILGGLFPMHEHNISRREQPCGAIKEEKGIQVRHLNMTCVTTSKKVISF